MLYPVLLQNNSHSEHVVGFYNTHGEFHIFNGVAEEWWYTILSTHDLGDTGKLFILGLEEGVFPVIIHTHDIMTVSFSFTLASIEVNFYHTMENLFQAIMTRVKK